MSFISWDELPEREVAKGFHARMVHGEKATHSLWRIEEGSILKLHSHPHEQFTYVLEGALELDVEGDVRVLHPGESAYIPSDAPHMGKALRPCLVMDFFAPVREDYRDAERPR
jgi:quercetin dioxygenase-like cupin family protein